ncbi:MAG: DUF2909 domain-containing protein [Pseudomonadota bacterium]|nr:DUF2909 domain-containing protein [Pseudomonadota bacterium]
MSAVYCQPITPRGLSVEFKYLVIVILVLILISLGKALFHLSSARAGQSGKMVKALSWRVALSVGLFVLLLVAHTRGWIQPQHVH